MASELAHQKSMFGFGLASKVKIPERSLALGKAQKQATERVHLLKRIIGVVIGHCQSLLKCC